MTSTSTHENLKKSLIREVINGKPYFHKNYQAVLNQNKKLEEVIGLGRLQSLIISALLSYFNPIFKTQFWLMIGNPVLQIDEGNQLILHLAFFKKSDLPPEKFDNHYYEEVPQIVFEVDVSIDLTKAEDQDYIFQKTQRLLDFGTEKVVWILTKSRKIMVAETDKSWTVDNWTKEFTVLTEKMILQDFLKEEGLIR